MFKNKSIPIFPALLLFFTTLVIYLPVIRFNFLSFDDQQFIFGNPYFAHGVNPDSLKWIFTAELFTPSPYADYWQPLAFLSHLLDIQLFGFNAGAHHVVSVLWHCVNAVLVFGLIQRLFKNTAMSFAAAAIFAWHPVQVETVAWIISRKHLLGCFWVLCGLHAYLSFLTKRSRTLYAAVTVLYMAAMMTKFNFVGFPLLLLLLDFWPLNRFNKTVFLKLIIEKIPLFLTGMLFLWIPMKEVTSYSARFNMPDLLLTLSLLTTNLLRQLIKLFYPLDLGVIRSLTFNTAVRWPEMMTALILLAGLTLICLMNRKRSPCWLMGWCWFLLFLIPVSLFRWPADRFVYLAILGAAVPLCYTVTYTRTSRFDLKTGKMMIAGLFLLLMIGITQRQLQFWKDDISFYKRGIAVSGDSYLFQNNLANAYAEQGNYAEAIKHYHEALSLLDKDPLAFLNLANVYMRMGEFAKAQEALEKVLSLNPDLEKARQFMVIVKQQLVQQTPSV